MTVLYAAVLIVAFIVIAWFIGTYNSFVRLKQQCRESWSGIETELKRRYNLIPNLVETVKGYAAHERQTLEMVIEARNRAAANNGTPAQQAKDENLFINALGNLFALAENYPQLKASENFLSLQKELTNTEDRIQAARRFYNANVRDINTRIAVFPSNMIAGLFSFQPEEFFEVTDSSMRQTVTVKM
ncbi:MAG TPA: LemA family protein [Phycisphaerae bacterium]|nr:LemA family protein [Phycisphaerae bacterium]HPS53319.1 LemA family protein [Phycisphaerae bacterium]